MKDIGSPWKSRNVKAVKRICKLSLIGGIVLLWLLLSLVCQIQYQIIAAKKKAVDTLPLQQRQRQRMEESSELFPADRYSRKYQIGETVEEGGKSQHAYNQGPRPLDPFRNIQLVSHQSNQKSGPLFSSYHCVQADQSGYPDFMARTCEYRNLYYNPSNQSFHYLARPQELSEYPNRSDLMDSMTVADGFIRWDALQMNSLESVSTTGIKFTYDWKPILETTSSFNTHRFSKIIHPTNPVFVLYLPSYSFNFGHLMFDDLLSIFSMLHMFGYAMDRHQYQSIPLFVERPNEAMGINFGSRDPFWRCHPEHKERWSKCIAMWSRVYPSLLGVTPDPKTGDILRTGNWLRGSAAIGEYDIMRSSKLRIHSLNDSNTLPYGDYVLLPIVINGPGRLANWACKGECAIGRGLWLWEFRCYLLKNVLGKEEASKDPISKRFIIISLPVGTTHADKVTHFDDIIDAAKQTFGPNLVKVVDMSKLSVKEQVQLVRVSAVYLTNHGGGSASAVFLPRDATLVIYHGIGRQGEPKMLDRHFWNSLGYVRVRWVHPNEHHNINKTMNFIQHGFDTFSQDENVFTY
jgi:Glycosyltransferase 61